jgi:hypothetical protein
LPLFDQDLEARQGMPDVLAIPRTSAAQMLQGPSLVTCDTP